MFQRNLGDPSKEGSGDGCLKKNPNQNPTQ